MKLSLLSDLSELSLLIWKLSKYIPKEDIFIIGNQLKRAILSARLNVREGNCFKGNNKIRFLNIAFGSLQETEECILMCFELRYLNSQQLKNFYDKYWLCLNKLRKLINSIKSDSQ